MAGAGGVSLAPRGVSVRTGAGCVTRAGGGGGVATGSVGAFASGDWRVDFVFEITGNAVSVVGGALSGALFNGRMTDTGSVDGSGGGGGGAGATTTGAAPVFDASAAEPLGARGPFAAAACAPAPVTGIAAPALVPALAPG